MSERHRALPPWMAKKEEKVKGKEPLKSRRKAKTARAAFYCMNEKELVEAAVSFLTSSACEDAVLRTGQKVKDITVKMTENPCSSKTTVKLVTLEESSDCCDAPEKTHVSETDSDITEVETVPYINSSQQQGPEGQRSGPLQEHGDLMKAGLDAEKKEKHIPVDATEEDDPLRLVREIFFT
ncbi:hypothetical protein D9C73_007435 [Collichthys lucidus]|uniref:Uncharacterized protein n=1 Tax=Collichthys lucidus TaxID=240159 RepID=A0A4U5UFG6_COLLU|nr:hypothetical protein D9C73_007435 [Collichthys lucidus]